MRLSRSSSSRSKVRPGRGGEARRRLVPARASLIARGRSGVAPPGQHRQVSLALIDGILDVLDMLGQEGREFGQFLQAGQAEPLQEVAGGAVQDGPGLGLGARLLDQAAQGERAQHAVAVDPADRGHPGPADRLPVGDHGQGLQGGLGEPDLLAVPDEALHHRGALGPGVEAPAARHLAQVEAALLGVVRGGQVAQGRRDLLPGTLQDLGDDDLRHRLVHHEQDRLQAGPQAGTSRRLGRPVTLRHVVQRGGLAVRGTFPVPGERRSVAAHRACPVLHAHPSSSSASSAVPASADSVPATQVTYRSPSGVTWSNETLPSR